MLFDIFDFLNTEGFSPHGLCLLWQPEVLWAHVLSDLFIALAYFSIPVALFVYSYKRGRVEYQWVIWLFGAFIIACGLTHLMGIWTMWVPDYGVQAIVKVICALISIATAVALWPLLPKALKLPTLGELEFQVAERTQKLHAANGALEEALARAQAANDAKTRFLSVMSHELRTPLNAIVGFADLMRLSQQSDEPMDFSEDVRQAGLHLTDIISDILDFSRIDTGSVKFEFESISSNALLDYVAETIKPIADAAGVTVHVAHETGAQNAYADPLRMRQALLNLVGNAVKYNTRGGRVDLSVESTPQQVIFCVADTGIGMSPKDIASAFEPFNRLGQENTMIQGSGLGLAVTQRFVKAMGGQIDITSNLDQGTVATITMLAAPPCEALHQTSEASSTQDGEATQTAKVKILAVEDNPVAVKLLTNILRFMEKDIEFVTAETLSQGRALFEAEKPDVLLLDLNLPDGNGLELLEELEKKGACVPTIIITADATEETRSKCSAFSFAQFHSKPYLVEDLIGAIRKSIVLAHA